MSKQRSPMWFGNLVGAAIVGLAAADLVRLFAVFAYESALSQGVLELDAWFLLAARPGLAATCAVTAALLWRGDQKWEWAASVLLVVAVLILDVMSPFGMVGWTGRVATFLPGVLSALALAVVGLFSRRRLSVAVVGAVAAATVLVVAGAHRGDESGETNSLGVLAMTPNRTWTYDFSLQSNKDNYPSCTFRDNSLGYRDEEPPGLEDGRTRVLLVGDSFVWGDGIPTNEQTLGARLRAELERLAPGRFAVISTGFPGNGIYGYSRAIDVLQAKFHPAVVIVGDLGESDHNLLDAQFLSDRLPHPGFVRNLLLNLHVAQYVHEASTSLGAIQESSRVEEHFRALRAEMVRKARERGHRLVFLAYMSTPSHVGEVLPLPDEWRYPGHSTDLWYAKDFHPKPQLNELLAGMLATKLLGDGAQR